MSEERNRSSPFDETIQEIIRRDMQKMGTLRIGSPEARKNVHNNPEAVSPFGRQRSPEQMEQDDADALPHLRNLKRSAEQDRGVRQRPQKHSRLSDEPSTSQPALDGVSPSDPDQEMDASASRRSVEEVMVRAAEHARKETKFAQGGFEFVSLAGHILESSCRHPAGVEDSTCLKCEYDRELKLGELPEMVFARNLLTVHFVGTPCSIVFSALEALKMVCDDQLPDVKVGASSVWQSARRERIQQMTTQHKPFDWTYTTYYKGTVIGGNVTATTDRIDMERLKRQDQILFSSVVTLFEDELADHGIAVLTARIRVMEGGYFFVLLRFYMRVDNVLIRVCDTRIVGNNGEKRVLREWQLREAKYETLGHVDASLLLDTDRAWMHLPVVREEIDYISVL